MAEVIKTEELEEIVEYWKGILKLTEWNIKTEICRGRNMRPGCAGTVNWELNHKDAYIRLLDPIDYPEDSMRGQNMEETLIHELLHLHLAPLSENFRTDKNEDIYTLFEEQAICAMASSLMKLKGAK